MRCAKRLAAGLVCGILAMACAAKAAPLDDRIPEDAVVYAGWAGSDSLAAKYAGSNLKGVMDHVKIAEYIRENWAGWMQKATGGKVEGAEVQADAAKNVEEVLQGMLLAWRHPTAIYVGPVGLADPNKPTFRWAILCDAGTDAPALVGTFKRLIARTAPPAELKMTVGLDGAVVIVTFGDITPEALMKEGGNAAARRLADLQSYKSIMGNMQKDPAAVIYVDAEKIVGTIGEAAEKSKLLPAQRKNSVTVMLQGLGLTSLKQLGYAGGFDGKEWREEGFIGIAGPRVGLLSLLETPPVTDTALAMVPKDAASMSVGHCDLAKNVQTGRDLMAKVDAGATQEFDKALAAAGKELGVDLEKDLLAALGDEWVSYRGPKLDDGTHPFVLLQKVKDGPALQKVLQAVEKEINQKAAGKLKIETLDAGKFEVSGIRLPQVISGGPSSLAWTVRDGVFYLSNIDGIGAAVDQVEGKGGSILANPAYQAMRAALPAVKATSVSYVEPAKLYPEFYRRMNGLLPMARLMGLDLPEDLLPMPKKVAEFMQPGGSVTWTDADGFHFASRSSFPGGQLLSSQTTPAGATRMTAQAAAR